MATSLFRVSKSGDRECQYNAALAFRRLSPNVESHAGIIGKGGLQPLFGLIQVKDVAIQRQSAAALRDCRQP